MSATFPRQWQANPLYKGDTQQTLIDDLRASSLYSGGKFAVENNQKIVNNRKGKVSISLLLDKNYCVAGDAVRGQLLVECRSSNIKIGRVCIKLVGSEGLEGVSRKFVSKRVVDIETIMLQGADLPPTECVECAPPDADYFWDAREGKSAVYFNIDAPVGLPSSFGSKRGWIAFALYAFAEIKVKGEKKATMLRAIRQVKVLERFPQYELNALCEKSVTDEAEKMLFMGGDGKVKLEATLTKSIWLSGHPLDVNVRVTNETKRRVVGLKLTLERRSKTFVLNKVDEGITPLDFFKEDVAELYVTDEGWWGGVAADSQREAIVSVQIPMDCMNVTGRLMDVSFMVRVEAFAKMSAPVSVLLPVKIVHGNSLERLINEKQQSSRHTISGYKDLKGKGKEVESIDWFAAMNQRNEKLFV